MKIYLAQILQEGRLHCVGEEDPSSLDLEEAGVTPINLLKYSIDIFFSEGELFASGEIAQRVKMNCVVCMEPFEKDIVTSFHAAQIAWNKTKFVDLTPWIREDIHLLLPAHPKCDRDGGKICSARFPSADFTNSSSMEKVTSLRGWETLDQLNILQSDGSP